MSSLDSLPGMCRNDLLGYRRQPLTTLSRRAYALRNVCTSHEHPEGTMRTAHHPPFGHFLPQGEGSQDSVPLPPGEGGAKRRVRVVSCAEAAYLRVPGDSREGCGVLPRQRQEEVSRGSRARRSKALASPTPGTERTKYRAATPARGGAIGQILVDAVGPK